MKNKKKFTEAQLHKLCIMLLYRETKSHRYDCLCYICELLDVINGFKSGIYNRRYYNELIKTINLEMENDINETRY